jgi:hypothetical protein
MSGFAMLRNDFRAAGRSVFASDDYWIFLHASPEPWVQLIPPSFKEMIRELLFTGESGAIEVVERTDTET